MVATSRITVFVATIAGVSAFWNTCPRGPVGSCVALSCSVTRGPTVCEHGQCNCIPGYCRYPNSRIHVQPRRCRAQVPGSSCHLTRFCYKGGVAFSSCVSGRCLCRTGMHVGGDGKCHLGWYPDPKDPFCKKDTGGTCRFLSCDSTRNSQCVSGHCVCSKSGTCSINGACQAFAPSPAALNTTGLPAYTADAETISEEDSEIAVNVATGVVLVALPTATVLGATLMVLRRLKSKRGDLAHHLLESAAEEPAAVS